MKHRHPISPQNQSNNRWKGDTYPLPSRSKPNKHCQSARLRQQCSGTGVVFCWWTLATRNNDQLRCLLRNSTEAPKSIAKLTARDAVKRCFAPRR
ncbi:hypothetical protein TNCV_1107361 [Trichonephila clavipes]|nr:hypothetical protein TNCV_1107361 [Trichonephila clavipes]